jgi:hypothetical protein
MCLLYALDHSMVYCGAKAKDWLSHCMACLTPFRSPDSQTDRSAPAAGLRAAAEAPIN